MNDEENNLTTPTTPINPTGSGGSRTAPTEGSAQTDRIAQMSGPAATLAIDPTVSGGLRAAPAEGFTQIDRIAQMSGPAATMANDPTVSGGSRTAPAEGFTQTNRIAQMSGPAATMANDPTVSGGSRTAPTEGFTPTDRIAQMSGPAATMANDPTVSGGSRTIPAEGSAQTNRIARMSGPAATMANDPTGSGGSRTAPTEGFTQTESNRNSNIPSRRSMRLQGYDYSQTGAYFITLCTRNRESLFGDIVEREMRLNVTGLIVAASWKWLATQYNHVELDEWVIMPNHLHGIIVITDDRMGGSRTAPTMRTTTPESQRKPIGRLIGAFKTISTKRINEYRSKMGSGIWQRNYYEHIIRNEPELSSIREYMQNNPMQWEMDSLFDNQLPY